MVEPVAAIGHNPDTRTLARIVGSRNQLRPHLVAATVGGIRRQTHHFAYRDSGLHCRNSKNRDNAHPGDATKHFSHIFHNCTPFLYP